MKRLTIDEYNQAQLGDEKRICDTLRQAIDHGLPEAESKVWHAHPVWFLDRNPVVGYSKLKNCIRLLSWSGQAFETQGLVAEGKFKAGEKRYSTVADIDRDLLQRWLEEARVIQLDYKNIVKRRGRLERLK
jgi:hypothetical protein